jgi:hypothetical protein
VCWLTSFPGAVWYSDHDGSSGAVVCKPYDEVAGVGQATYLLVRFWAALRSLPIP